MHALRYVLARISITTIAIFLTVQLVPGLEVADRFSSAQGWNALIYVALGAGFWVCAAVLWPVLLVVSGRIIIWTFGLALVILNGLLFYLSTTLLRIIVVDPPVALWIGVGAVVFTCILTILELGTGLDTPYASRGPRQHGYWYALNRFSLGSRNALVENLRIAQLLDISTRYLKAIVVTGLPVAGSRRFFQRLISPHRPAVVTTSTAHIVRLMLQDLGPTFVKVGQVVASRAEQLPSTWRTELEHLHSAVAPFPYAEAERLVREQFGQPIDSLFASFEPAPLAAASTAQVHRATLVDGTAVVVKVQRPDIDVTVRADLNVIRDLARLLERRFTWARESHIRGIVNEYADNIVRELDYQNEAANGRYLAQTMQEFSDIHVPTVYSERSTARVMTQEFVTGVPITDVLALDQASIDRAAVARVFMRAMVKQVLFDGFFHGDPHPGNVMVNRETGQIIFLDMGMMGSLTTQKRLALADLIWSMHERDGREIARGALALTTRFKDVDEEKFLQNSELLLKRYTAVAASTMSLAAAMKLLVDALSTAGLRVDSDLTLAIKALVQAEQIVSTLAPELPMVEVAFEETQRLLRQQFDSDVILDTLRRQAVRGAKEAVRRIPDLPDALMRWLDGFQRGGFTLTIDADKVSTQIHELDASLTRNVRSLVLSLLLVGLLIGSSIASAVVTPGNLLLQWVANAIFISSAVVAGLMVLGFVWRWLNQGEL